MPHRPLSEIRDTLKPQWYRSKMRPERFRELSKRDDRKGWVQAGGHFALFCLTSLAVYLTWAQGVWLLFRDRGRLIHQKFAGIQTKIPADYYLQYSHQS